MISIRKNKTKGRGFLLAAGLMLALSGILAGCGSQSASEENGMTKIVVGIDKFEPYSYLDANGNYKGIDIELATAAFEKLGYEPEFKFIDWEEKDDDLSDGTIDCIWSCYSMTGREDKYQWAGPYMYSRQVIAVQTDSDIYSLSDLEGKNVGVQTTTKAEGLFLHKIESAIPQVEQVNAFSTAEEVFAALRKGYVDAIVGHEALISQLVVDGNGAYRLLDESPYESQIGVAFEKDTHEQLAQDLTQTLEEMKQDGTIDKIAKNYGLDPEKAVWGGATDE